MTTFDSGWFDATYFGHTPTADHKSNYSRVGGYNAQVAGASQWAAFVAEQFAKYEHLEPHRPTILDIGCADGAAVKELRTIGIDAYGVDISDYILSTADPDVKPYLAQADARYVRDAELVRDHAVFRIAASKDLLEHLDEDEIGAALLDIACISLMQVHIVNTGEHEYQAFDGDRSHITRKPLSWYVELTAKLHVDAAFFAT